MEKKNKSYHTEIEVYYEHQLYTTKNLNERVNELTPEPINTNEIALIPFSLNKTLEGKQLRLIQSIMTHRNSQPENIPNHFEKLHYTVLCKTCCEKIIEPRNKGLL